VVVQQLPTNTKHTRKATVCIAWNPVATDYWQWAQENRVKIKTTEVVIQNDDE